MRQQSIFSHCRPKLSIKTPPTASTRTYGSSAKSKKRSRSLSVSSRLVAPKVSHAHNLRQRKTRRGDYAVDDVEDDDDEEEEHLDQDGGSRRVEQMHLDFGQTQVTVCTVCLMSYEVAIDADLHQKYHQEYLKGITWAPTSQQCARLFSNDQFSVVKPLKQSYKALGQLRSMVDQQLGSSGDDVVDEQAFVLVALKENRCIGYLSASQCSTAFRLSDAGDDDQVTCSSEPVEVVCGIDKIWVIEGMRRKSVATKMIEVLRKKFSYGRVLEKDQIAFSQPTQLGRSLGSSFFGTETFLVFR